MTAFGKPLNIPIQNSKRFLWFLSISSWKTSEHLKLRAAAEEGTGQPSMGQASRQQGKRLHWV